jgi:hypothetical protein
MPTIGSMTESTTEFTERVKGEGRFDEFKAFRQALEGRGSGKKESWEQAAAQFGWEPPSGGGGRSKRSNPIQLSDDVDAAVFSGKTSNLRSDYQWVYENVAVGGVSASDAPSAGSWGLLQFARDDPRSFYTEWMRMVSRSEDVDKQMEAFKDDARSTVADIRAMLDEFRSATVPDSAEVV